MAKNKFSKAKAHAFAGLAAALLFATELVLVGCNNDPEPVETKNEYPAPTGFTAVALDGIVVLYWDEDLYSDNDEILRTGGTGGAISVSASGGYAIDTHIKNGVEYTYTLYRELNGNVSSVSQTVTAKVPADGGTVTATAPTIATTVYKSESWTGTGSEHGDGVRVTLGGLNPIFSYEVYVYEKENAFSTAGVGDNGFSPSEGQQVGNYQQVSLYDNIEKDGTASFTVKKSSSAPIEANARVVISVSVNYLYRNAYVTDYKVVPNNYANTAYYAVGAVTF